MIGTWRDVAVFLDGSPIGERVAARAADIARRHAAHLIGVYGAVHPRAAAPADSHARGAEAMTQVLERYRRATEAKVLAAGRAFEAVTGARAISSEYRVVWRDSVDDDAALRALHCDLAICARPKPVELPQGWTGEHILLASGVPVLLLPDEWRGPTTAERIVVAWNGSREARRAVADALPLLAKAEAVTVVSIERHDDRADPGDDLMRHLDRHGVKATFQAVKRSDRSTSELLMQAVEDREADFLVIGAYSRPRSAELLFGGTTRKLLSDCPVPLFLSR